MIPTRELGAHLPVSEDTEHESVSVDETVFACDLCGREFRGRPGGSGLLLWTRGDEVRYEEPPLCRKCATKLTVGALSMWEEEPDEG